MIIRTALQLLEKQGLVKKGKNGRELTSKARSLLDKTASEVKNG
jgi:ribosomal protein S19E (S16A)